MKVEAMETTGIQTILPKEYTPNDTLPNLWVDNASILTRADNISLISFYTHLPSGMIEQTRIMAKKETLQSLADAICRNLNYYPKKKLAGKVAKK